MWLQNPEDYLKCNTTLENLKTCMRFVILLVWLTRCAVDGTVLQQAGAFYSVLLFFSSYRFRFFVSPFLPGTLPDDITSHCVITKFVPLIHQFDDCLEAALKSLKTSLDDDQCSSLHDALGWRLRFSGLGNLQLVSSDRKKQGKKTRNLVEEAVSKLSVHYRWLVKWTVPKLQSVIDSDETL